jgi:hypothetical protein
MQPMELDGAAGNGSAADDASVLDAQIRALENQIEHLVRSNAEVSRDGHEPPIPSLCTGCAPDG